jgi:hypothetical protein
MVVLSQVLTLIDLVEQIMSFEVNGSLAVNFFIPFQSVISVDIDRLSSTDNEL